MYMETHTCGPGGPRAIGGPPSRYLSRSASGVRPRGPWVTSLPFFPPACLFFMCLLIFILAFSQQMPTWCSFRDSLRGVSVNNLDFRGIPFRSISVVGGFHCVGRVRIRGEVFGKSDCVAFQNPRSRHSNWVCPN